MLSRTVILVVALLFSFAASDIGHADTPLEITMKKMSRAYKALSFDLQQPSDAHKGDYLQLATILKEGAQTSRGLVPKKADTLSADQQVKMVKEYQKSMDDLIGWINSLTQDIRGSQWETARSAMATIKLQMKEGHSEFRTKD